MGSSFLRTQKLHTHTLKIRGHFNQSCTVRAPRSLTATNDRATEKEQSQHDFTKQQLQLVNVLIKTIPSAVVREGTGQGEEEHQQSGLTFIKIQ